MHTFENHEAGTSTRRADSFDASSRRRRPPPASRRESEPLLNPAHRIAVIEPELRRAVDAELSDGERIVWLRQPEPRLARRGTWPVVIFGIPWTAFSIFWTACAAGFGMNAKGPAGWFAYVFPLWGVPFILIGLGMLSAPYWASRAARRTVYAITDRRALVRIDKGWGNIEVQHFAPARLVSMTRSERADGSGDLIFEQFEQPNGSGTTTVKRGFTALADVREAEDVLRETLLRMRDERRGCARQPS